MDGYDTIFHFAQPAAPLPMHTRGLVSLFNVCRLIEDTYGQLVALLPRYPLLDQISQTQFIPLVQGQELLQVSRLQPRGIRHRLQAFARQSGQLPQNVSFEMLYRFPTPETVVKLPQEFVQHRSQLLNLFCIHAITPLDIRSSKKSYRMVA
jgi:hypothetical protein